MEIKQQIKLKTKDSQLLFKIKVGNKRTLVDAVMFKIAILYTLAKRRNIYAFHYLMQIQYNIEKVLTEIQLQIKKSRELLQQRIGDLKTISFPTLETRQLGFSNPIHYGIIQTVLLFDESVSWLILARNSNLFTHQNGFYGVKDSIRKKVFQLLSQIIGIKTKDFPNINFNHYLENEEAYQVAKLTLGDLDPQHIYNAIHSAATPSLSPEELNRITAKLKTRISNNTENAPIETKETKEGS